MTTKRSPTRAPCTYISGTSLITFRGDVRFYIDWIERLIARVKERGRSTTGERRAEVVALFERAYKRLQQIRLPPPRENAPAPDCITIRLGNVARPFQAACAVQRAYLCDCPKYTPARGRRCRLAPATLPASNPAAVDLNPVRARSTNVSADRSHRRPVKTLALTA
jgi:hypothetical protein